MTMQATKVGNKYQVVVPSYAREVMTMIEPGAKVVVIPQDKGTGILKVVSENWVNGAYGKYKGWWGKNSAKYLRDLRNEWN